MMEEIFGTNCLEKVILRVKVLNLEEPPLETLSTFLAPPSRKDVENSIFALKEVGALLHTCRGAVSLLDGDITFMGRVINELSIDIKLGKLIILGQLFDCLEETVIIAAGSSISDLFVDDKLPGYKQLLIWANGSCSDQIAYLNLYQSWQTFSVQIGDGSFEKENEWCLKSLINLQAMKKWISLVAELKQQLQLQGIKTTIGPKVSISAEDKLLLLNIIIAGAFYPNYFIHEPKKIHAKYYKSMELVGGRNPLASVYFTGVKPSQNRSSVIELLTKQGFDKDKAIIGLDGVRVYAEFKSFELQSGVISVIEGVQQMSLMVPGKSPYEVYEALRKRQLELASQLSLPSQPSLPSPSSSAADNVRMQEEIALLERPSTSSTGRRYSRSRFSPPPGFILLQASEFIDAGHFWAHPSKNIVLLPVITATLNNEELIQVIAFQDDPDSVVLDLEQFYGARYDKDNLFYRCKVIVQDVDSVLIMFIDYGNLQTVRLDEVYWLPHRLECNLPPLSMECILYGIRPNPHNNPTGIWPDRVNKICKRQIMDVVLFGKIKTVIDSVVYLELYVRKPTSPMVKSVNEILIERGHAVRLESSEKKETTVEPSPSTSKASPSTSKASPSTSKEVLETTQEDAEASLEGPFSPLTIKLEGCITNYKTKIINLNEASVNTVLLETDPKSAHTRMLTAGVTTETGQNNLRLNDTTVLPNIPGLPMFTSLLFCPRMTLKLTRDQTKVASILCGFGFDELANKSWYPSHDLTLTVDTILTVQEINRINKIRGYMNEGVNALRDNLEDSAAEIEVIRIQNCLKKELKELIHMQRRMTRRVEVEDSNVWPNNQPGTDVFEPNLVRDSEDIWPMLQFVELKPEQGQDPNLEQNLDDLDRAARNARFGEALRCELCEESLETTIQVRLHLKSDSHQKNLENYYARFEL